MARIPSVTFNESNTGFVPIRQNIRNRIAIVSRFSRGPVQPTFITGDTFFANTFGSDTTVGSVAYQAARDQDAEDFLLVRVLGNAKSATGLITFTGIATKKNTLFVNIRFISDATPVTPIRDLITTTGTYTGSVSGRYFFYVDAVSGSVATVKYTFVPLGGNEKVDWDTITDNISVNLDTDKGVPKTIENGVEVTFGQAAQTNNIVLVAEDQFKVRVNAYTFPVEISEGDIPSQLANSFKEAITGREVIGDVTINATNNGAIFEVSKSTDELLGIIGNKFNYSYSLLDPVDPGFSTTPALDTSNFMTGGEEGPRQAYRDFYSLNGTPLLRLQSNYAGDYGNNIRVTLFPDSQSRYRVVISDLNGGRFNPPLESESFTFDFANTDNNGIIEQLNRSIYVNGIFLPKFNDPVNYDTNLVNQAPLRLAPANTAITDPDDTAHPDHYGPSRLVNVSLEEGFDGPVITDDDYVRAIKSLASYPVHLVLCPGIHSNPTIEQAMIAHCESESDKDGLRIAILNARPSLLPNAARQETFGLDSKRAVKVVGWSTYAGQINATKFSQSPDAIYAGKMAFIPFYASPHARRTAGSVKGLSEVDTVTTSSTQALQLFTDAKLEVLQVDPSNQTFVFTNGSSLSSDETWRRISVRRTYDVIRQDLYEVLTSYLGEPHTNKLRVQVESSVTSYLKELLRLGQIANYKNVTANDSNNGPELYQEGILNVSFDFLPLFPVDYIRVNITRSTEDGLIQLGV